MHELSVATAIVNTALKHAAGRRVTVVTVSAGRLRQVVPDTLQFYWDLVTRESDCAGARLELIVVPVRLRCRACAHEWEPELPLFHCPECVGGGDVEVLSGEELLVESIEVEEDVPCTA